MRLIGAATNKPPHATQSSRKGNKRNRMEGNRSQTKLPQSFPNRTIRLHSVYTYNQHVIPQYREVG